MKKHYNRRSIGAAIAMLILILDGETAVCGIRDGITLCLQTLIPSLFPFFLLSMLITSGLSGQSLSILRPIGTLCGIPKGSEPLLVIGFLGGYPVGAQNVALAYRQGRLTRRDAERMICFCSNAGPAFLFGILGHAFGIPGMTWMLWGIQILSALLVGMLTSSGPSHHQISISTPRLSITQSLNLAITVMARSCGWVVLFRMVISYLERWFLWRLPPDFQVLLYGILELSNGCLRITSLSSIGMRFVYAAALLSFGGCCVCLQTAAVAETLGLRCYLPGKLLQGCISFLLALTVQRILPSAEQYHPGLALPFLVIGIGSICLLYLRKSKISSSIPSTIGV